MRHRLVMLYGASPGTGKTTLGAALVKELRNVALVAEEDVLHLPEFAPAVRALQHGEGDPAEACLQAARGFVESRLNAGDITITDSIFPCYTWLFAAGLSFEATARFNDELAVILAPLHPLIIYLDGDVPAMLSRAVSQRGEMWLDELIEDVRGYTVCQGRPMSNFADVATFFSSCKAFGKRLLADWPGEVLTVRADVLTVEDVARRVTAWLQKHD